MIDSVNSGSMLNHSAERSARASSGYAMLVVLLMAVAGIIAGAAMSDQDKALGVTTLFASAGIFAIVLLGFYVLQPNQAAAITLFGSYKGTDRTTGLRWVLPWMTRKKVSL
ncbi:MAG: SPFH domain-containing protein, partial [Sphingomonas sp.]